MTDLDRREHAIGEEPAKQTDKPREPHCELALWQKVADCAHHGCRQEGRCVAVDYR
jgi:hypothetical protein